MREITLKIYKFEELPGKSKLKAIDDFIYSDFFNYLLDEYVNSIKTLSECIGGNYDYSLSLIEDRCEFIKFSNYDATILKELYDKRESCPLTGFVGDILVIEALYHSDMQKIIDSIHCEFEYQTKEENIKELCEINNYEFLEDGTFY
jgi:hypothetical protein